MSDAPDEPADPQSEAPRNPLERFTSGGWLKGLVRLAIGIGILAAVLHWGARAAVDKLVEREVTAALALGAAIHLVQRIARILKWARMIEPSGLVERRWTFLLRVQLIGMLANLLLPVSEALKIWALSRNRRDILVTTESLFLDVALHNAMVCGLGVLGVIALGASAGSVLRAAAWLLTLAPLLLIMALQWRNRKHRTMRLADARVLGWCGLETVCQVAIYAIAFRAIGIDVGVVHVLALSPLLFLGDLVMVTPSGLGLREALFAVVLQTLSGAPADTSVAVALCVTTMLLVASAVGGTLALAAPGGSVTAR